MRWSARKQRIASQLHEIEQARKSAAEALLAGARAELAEAGRVRAESEDALDSAERGWRDHLSSKSFDLELGQAFAAQLMEQQRELELSQDSESRADMAAADARQGWQKAEASVRLGERVVQRGRNRLAKQSERARDSELADRTAWKWFSR